jgi:hypothetical protein
MTSRTVRGNRPPRNWWFDPRFAIGLALVVASVLGVSAIVNAADTSARFYAARAALSPGDRIHPGDLVEQSVRLGGAGAHYLARRDVPDAGLVITRPVAAGELVPASAVGSVAGLTVTSVVITVDGQLARAIDSGAVVDLWAAHQTADRVYGAPTVLVSSATVVRLIKAEGIIADGRSGSVELLVPRNKTARVLEAIANDDALSLVPTSLPAGK